MGKFFNALSLVMAAIGLWLGLFLGPFNGLLIALVCFIVADYITGVASAIINKKMSSAVGFKGILRKVLILCIVGVANLLDVYVLKSGEMLRAMVIFFYIANEGLSILENAGECGLPIPKKIKEILAQLRDKNDGGEDNGQSNDSAGADQNTEKG